MSVFECPERHHGCGVHWTPDHDRRPNRRPPLALCPDCEAALHRGECDCSLCTEGIDDG